MNILLLGSGGREHALAWSIRKSILCERLFIAPGNAGTAKEGTNVQLDILDFKEVKIFVLENKIDMVVVGPEDPLVEGVFDFFKADKDLKNIPVIGPSAKGALLEGSKSFAKQFMIKYNIPTAGHKEYVANEMDEGVEHIKKGQAPFVIKADGLAAGKGVVIAQSKEEATSEFISMLQGKFGAAGSKVVIEEFLEGIEVSVFVFTDGKNYKILPTAKDYKRIGEGDTGLNTGGMGVVSPVPFADKVFMDKVEDQVIKPTIKGLQQEQIIYKGIIYFGLMNVDGEPKVIEYNCRFGDPEAEVLLPMIKTDVVEILSVIANETLDTVEIDFDERACATIILASGGYPENYEKGKEITGFEGIEDSLIFHAGTKAEADKILTNGGRVMAVTSFGKSIQDAVNKSIQNAQKIKFEGKYFRKDIGWEFK